MTLTMVIDGWLPERLNVLLGAHWTRRRRLRQEAGQRVGVARAMAGLPRGCEVKRRVSVVFYQARGVPADPDARWKHLLDALVESGLLRDDGPAWCELGTVQTVRGPRRTVVTLEDLG